MRTRLSETERAWQCAQDLDLEPDEFSSEHLGWTLRRTLRQLQKAEVMAMKVAQVFRNAQDEQRDGGSYETSGSIAARSKRCLSTVTHEVGAVLETLDDFFEAPTRRRFETNKFLPSPLTKSEVDPFITDIERAPSLLTSFVHDAVLGVDVALRAVDAAYNCREFSMRAFEEAIARAHRGVRDALDALGVLSASVDLIIHVRPAEKAANAESRATLLLGQRRKRVLETSTFKHDLVAFPERFRNIDPPLH